MHFKFFNINNINFNRLYINFYGIIFISIIPLFITIIQIYNGELRKLLSNSILFLIIIFAWINFNKIYKKNSIKLICISTLILSSFYINYYIFDGWLLFGWHNLMQLDAIYSSDIGRIDIFYFMNRLTYPYFGLLPLSFFSKIFDISPLILYPLFNGLFFILWFATYNDYLMRFDKRENTAISVAITFLYSGIGVFIYLIFSKFFTSLFSIFDVSLTLPGVENRASPIFSKFPYIDAMTLGLPYLALQYYFLRFKKNTSLLISCLCGTQVILTYPLLGPVVVLVSLSSLVFTKNKKFISASITLILILTLYCILSTLSTDTGGPSIHLQSSPKHLIFNLFCALLILLPFLALIFLRIYRLNSIYDVRSEIFIVAICILAFCLIILPASVQYKFLYGAMVILFFPASSEILRLIILLRKKFGNTGVVWIIIIGFLISTLQLADQAPKLNARKISIENISYYIKKRFRY